MLFEETMQSITHQPTVDDSVLAITTTVPVETIFAAGLKPLDLNNMFVSSANPEDLVREAEGAGLPRNMCAWVKGLYAAALRLGVRRIVGVVQGDCSNTHGLLELLADAGVEVVPFAFPFGRDAELLSTQLERFRLALGADADAVAREKARLDRIRSLAHEIDRRTWRDGAVSGEENHFWTITCSDFMGDPDRYEREARAFLHESAERPPRSADVRIGYVGVPPISPDLYDFVERLGASVVFNEVQRQFSMPFETSSLLEQYRAYTYPYEARYRIEDITAEIARRGIHGLIHYVQSFCYRQMHDKLLRKALGVPVLTLECDRPGPLDAAARTRIEAFVEMIRRRLETQ